MIWPEILKDSEFHLVIAVEILTSTVRILGDVSQPSCALLQSELVACPSSPTLAGRLKEAKPNAKRHKVCWPVPSVLFCGVGFRSSPSLGVPHKYRYCLSPHALPAYT